MRRCTDQITQLLGNLISLNYLCGEKPSPFPVPDVAGQELPIYLGTERHSLREIVECPSLLTPLYGENTTDITVYVFFLPYFICCFSRIKVQREKYVHRLLIVTTKMSDSGKYTVVAGGNMSSANLTVEGRDVRIRSLKKDVQVSCLLGS